MKYEWLESYCLSKPGAVKDYKAEWEAFRYMIFDKMFLMDGGDKNHNPIITLKLDPIFGDEMRKKYADISPGYYMNKVHWNSINRNGKVPDKLLKSFIDESYRLILESLPKKKQLEVTEKKNAHQG